MMITRVKMPYGTYNLLMLVKIYAIYAKKYIYIYYFLLKRLFMILSQMKRLLFKTRLRIEIKRLNFFFLKKKNNIRLIINHRVSRKSRIPVIKNAVHFRIYHVLKIYLDLIN